MVESEGHTDKERKRAEETDAGIKERKVLM